jgi:integrase
MLDGTLGNDVQQLRDHAVLLLLSGYALRPDQVRSVRLDDINWQEGRIRVVRSKSGRQERLPLEPTVGNAIARYLHRDRPASPSRIIFLRLRAPIRPLSPSGLHYMVKRQYRGLLTPAKGRGT